MKRLSQEAVTVLGSMETQGNLAFIKAGQLDRKLYAEVNKALEAIGGKWMKKAKAHEFTGDPRDALDKVIFSGGFTDMKSEFGFFETPLSIADKLAESLQLKPGMSVLEPSAGHGRLVKSIERLEINGIDYTMVDIQQANVDFLRGVGYGGSFGKLVCADFLEYNPGQTFDRVAMNPPFARQADLEHVTKALFHTKVGGRLVAIMSAGVQFRENKKTKDFMQMLQDNSSSFGFEALPEGSFQESGTGVNTVMLMVDKA